MRQIYFIVIYLLCRGTLFSQQLDITVNHLNVDRAYLFALSGEKTSQIDSITSSGNGRFQFSLNRNDIHPGFYRLSFDKNEWIDFINDGEDLTLTTDANNISDSLKVDASESNSLYYSFIKLKKQYKTKTELLQLVLARYPKDDEYYTATKTKIAQLEKEYFEFIQNVSQKEPNSFIARYIRSSQLSVPDYNQSVEKQLAFLKVYALDNVDFNDVGLIYSDAFTSKTIEYLTYYRNPQLPKELLEKEFMVAVDTILNKAKVNHLVYQHLVEYLIDGFKKFGFDQPLDYIVENYVIKDDLCLDVKTEGLIKRRIDQAKYFKTGGVVPDILLPDSSGNEVKLTNIKSGKILIVFYSSSCPHCQTMLPKLRESYQKQKEKIIEIAAISLDDKREEWLDFIRTNNLNWINVSDLKGWDGKAALDYYIYATPTMFLVDNDRKIISKPRTVEEITRIMEGK
jgi:peroxiredoxin